MHNASHKRRVNVVPFGHFYLKAAKTRGLSGTAPYEPLRRRRRAHHALEQGASVDPASGLPVGSEVVMHIALRDLRVLTHGMPLGLSTVTETATGRTGRTSRPPRSPVERQVPINPCDDVS